MQRQQRWLGHVIKMSFNRLPRRVLYGDRTSSWVSFTGCSEEALFWPRESHAEEMQHIPADRLESAAYLKFGKGGGGMASARSASL